MSPHYLHRTRTVATNDNLLLIRWNLDITDGQETGKIVRLN